MPRAPRPTHPLPPLVTSSVEGLRTIQDRPQPEPALSTLEAIDTAATEIWQVALGLGLDPYPTHFELVPATMMYELGAYGIPGRFSHWTHGKQYFQMKTMHDYGLSKIYELVINANPSQAFLMEANALVENKMVIAHVLGHTDFFKHNMYFGHTSRQMVETAGLNAERIARYEFQHGLLAVEKFLDAVLSIKEHFGFQPGFSQNKAEQGDRAGARDPLERRSSPYDDLWDLDSSPASSSLTPDPTAKPFPSAPEKDILGFLMRHARDLQEWQRDIISIVRQEMLYFLPQMQTKMLNEGWAVLWHQRIMNELDLTPAEHAQFGTLHAGVVSPGGRMRINPYYVGYKILLDIERRWNEPTADERERLGRQPGGGLAKLFAVREAENDQSLIRKYLTEELVRDLDLYTYRLVDDEWQVADTDWRVVRDALARGMDNVGLPYIVVEDADYNHNRELYLRHCYDGSELDIRYAEKTLHYLYLLWNRAVHLETVIDGQKARLAYDGRRNSKTAL